MNQILVTNNGFNKNDKNNIKQPKVEKQKAPKNYSAEASTNGIVRIFAILIIIFGLVISGSGAYAMMQNIEDEKSDNKPSAEATKNGNTVNITVKCNNGIRSITYFWNSSNQSKTIPGKNNKEVTFSAEIPEGTNKLNINIVDTKGTQRNLFKNFTHEDGDVTEPQITFDVVNSDVRITVTDDSALDYIVYKYGDQDEVTINAAREDQTKIEAFVPVIQGQATLKVEAVDAAQNYATKEQEIKGVKKPTIEVIPDPSDPSYIVIKASDEDGLRMVSYYINGQEYKTDPNTSLNSKTFEWRQKVEKGETNVTVHAYNINEQVTEFVGVYSY